MTEAATAPGAGDARRGPSAWAVGLATVADDGAVLDTWYPAPQLGEPDSAFDLLGVPPELAALEGADLRRRIRTTVVRSVIDLTAAPTTVPDAYLRLHLLSHRLVQPHGLNLTGLFSVLPNVVWTSHGPCRVEDFETTRMRLWVDRPRSGPVQVFGVDKFPRMTDYVVPSGVRIADADRVRLGAHLAPGTTVMHEGFVNFNAGTLGTSMIEGRISAGVVVGDGSDVGGGASIMGTLSGGGTEVIRVGRRCLLGANSGIGISLGDDCVVEAGCYVTAGTKLTLLPVPGTPDTPLTTKAAALSGASGLLFRRNSVTGAVEALPRPDRRVALNAALHAND